MASIAIVRVRTAQDVVWNPQPWVVRGLELLGLGALARRLRAATGRPFLAQLTLPYLAALVHAERPEGGHRCLLVDEPEERILAALPDDLDAVFLTANTHSAPAAYRVAERLRARGLPVVIGGIHPTMLPDEAALHADAVVLGEAEGQIGTVLDDLARPSGLAPRYSAPRLRNLGGLPTPRWWDAPAGVDLCPWVIPVQTSRGCRNACSFCSTTRFQGAQRRHRPVQEIVAELRELQERGVLTPDKTVFFTDNNIVCDSDHRRGQADTAYARSLFEALLPLGIDWVGQGEVGIADDPELLHLAAASGMLLLLVGFESLDQERLAALGKPSNQVERYVRQVEALHRQGVGLIGCFILGIEGEDRASIERSLPFIERYIDIPQISVLTPYPGTKLHRDLVRRERVLDPDWSHYDITHPVCAPESMSLAELEATYRHVTERLYRPSAMLGRGLRAATRALDGDAPRRSFATRFSSVFAPNLIYRELGRIGRSPAAAPLGSRAAWPRWSEGVHPAEASALR